jgi:hypothetical protein
MHRRCVRLALVALLALPFGSCTCGSHTPEPPPTPAARKLGGWSIKTTPRAAHEQAEGEIVRSAPEAREAPTVSGTPSGPAELPADFPADIPVPEGAEVTAASEGPQGSQNVVFAADAETPKLFSLYKDNMSGNGWKVEQEYGGKERSFLSFKKGDTITNVMISEDPKTGKKVVAVMYYEEEPLPFPEF